MNDAAADADLATTANPVVPSLETVLQSLVDSYDKEQGIAHIDSEFLPNRGKVIQLIEVLRKLVFPGFFDDAVLKASELEAHAGTLLDRAYALLKDQINQALRYQQNQQGKRPEDCGGCDEKAHQMAMAVLAELPEIRRLLATDVQAAFDGDPAADALDETIFCYPGVDAIFIHRVAHQLYKQGLPVMARIASEYAHNESGIDIHPGAQIDESFFIDHGTGVVIGETCRIGKHVKVYQGVTLGALSTKGGQGWHGRIRHPKIEDNVTIYAGATILGGDTVVGEGATINGGVFLTASVPPKVTVGNPPVQHHIRGPKKRGDA